MKKISIAFKTRFFCILTKIFSLILTKIGEITVLMSTAVSPSLVKIDQKTKKDLSVCKILAGPLLKL